MVISVIDLPDDYSHSDNLQSSYDFLLTCVPATHNSWANRNFMTKALPLGILRRVQITFPNGCNNRIFCNVYHVATQVFPVDPVGAPGTYYYVYNNYLLDFETFQVQDAASQNYTMNVWTDGGADIDWNHNIRFAFFVEQVVTP
jgi:hypothetical protein